MKCYLAAGAGADHSTGSARDLGLDMRSEALKRIKRVAGVLKQREVAIKLTWEQN